jgi:hypothetical protein
MRPIRELSRDEHHLLVVLGNEKGSIYSVVKGPALSALFNLDMAKFQTRDERGRDYDHVVLTEYGWAVLARMGPTLPRRFYGKRSG